MSFFFFNDTATTEIYTLSLHDALPIYEHLRAAERLVAVHIENADHVVPALLRPRLDGLPHFSVAVKGELHPPDRKSTRLNSRPLGISYAVFCLENKSAHDAQHQRLLSG